MRQIIVIGAIFFGGLVLGGPSSVLRAQDYVGLTVQQLQVRLKKESRPRQQPSRSLSPSFATKEIYRAAVSTAIDLQLGCDSTGLCFAEQYLCEDESAALACERKILAKKEYGWQALNENQHVSSMERQRLLEIYRHESFWVVQVLRTNWSPLQYQLLFSSTLNLAK
ncbi:MAG: hypothetical protein ACKOD1_05975 [Sphingomonadales bacterium]